MRWLIAVTLLALVPALAGAQDTKRLAPERRILGLPVTAVLVIAAVILGIVALAGLVLPRARPAARARGHGTYGRR